MSLFQYGFVDLMKTNLKLLLSFRSSKGLFKGPVINSSRGGGGRHLGGGPKFYTVRGVEMTNKEHFTGRSMGSLLNFWSGVQKYLHKSKRGDKNFIKYIRSSSTPSPQVINDPSPSPTVFSMCH